MTIKKQLILLIILIILSFSLICVLNLINSKVSSNFIKLKDEAYTVNKHLYSINIATRDLLYSNYLQKAYNDWKEINSKCQDIVAYFLQSKNLTKLIKKNKELSNQYNLTLYNWNIIKTNLSDISIKMDNFSYISIENTKGIFYLLNETTGNKELFEVYTAIHRTIQSLNITILDSFEQINDSLNNEINTTTSFNNITASSLSILIIIIMLILFLKFLNKLHFKLNGIRDIMKAVSERDFNLNIDIKGKDEFKDLANYINDSLNKLKDIFNKIKNVSIITDDLSSIVNNELSSSKDSLTVITGDIKSIKSEYENFDNNIKASSASTMEIQNNLNSLKEQIHTQSTTVIQSSASIEEIIASINNITFSTKERKDSALKLFEIIKAGNKDINETNVLIQEINKNTQNIQEILDIIKGISVQINLLSMNAAIESAHAGESGKGFSVVADEIRKLAESTSENSKSIEDYIQHIISLINGATETSNKNMQSYKTIVHEVNKLIELFEEISSGLEEMSISSKEILNVNKTLNDLTIDVKNKYDTIINENRDTGTAISNLNNISSTIFRNISGIYVNIGDIMNKTDSILSKQNDSRNNMKNINEELIRFKT